MLSPLQTLPTAAAQTPETSLPKIMRMLAKAREYRHEAFGRGLGRALGLEASAEFSLKHITACEDEANYLLDIWQDSLSDTPACLRSWQYFSKFYEAKLLSERAEEQAQKLRSNLRAERHEWNRILKQNV